MGAQVYHTNHFNSTEFPNLVDEIVFYEFEENSPVQLSPGAYFEIIFQFGDFYQTLPKSSAWIKRPTAFIGGLHCQPFAVSSAGKAGGLMSIRLEAEMARHFVPGNLNAYKNRVVDLSKIFNPTILEHLSQFSQVNQASEKLELTELFLKSIYKSKSFSPIDDAVRFIKDEMGTVSLTNVSEKVNLGDSQFRKRFNEEIGLSPKEFIRITRINAICEHLKNGKYESLTEVGYRFNYFDQSHFIKDFKSVKGITPKQFLKGSEI